MKRFVRRLRGALGNALVWAVGWFGAGFLLITAINIFGIGTFRRYTTFALLDALRYATSMAVVGFVTGGAFSMYVAAAFRNQQLQDVSPGRFALGGALVAVLLSLGLIGIITGFEVFLLEDLVIPIVMPAILGGATGYASIKLAKRALPSAEDSAGLLEP